MYSHNMVGTNDTARAKVFYDALFTAMGGKAGMQDAKGRLIYMHNDAMFMVTPPINGEPATAGNGCTIGFNIDSPEMADAWHAAGVANGGTAIENPPGWRDMGSFKLYLAYLRDPDGNKLCALKRG
jgi:catechol 2,3-dioxygenase-like lactoylglutathione lyase family enzyme